MGKQAHSEEEIPGKYLPDHCNGFLYVISSKVGLETSDLLGQSVHPTKNDEEYVVTGSLAQRVPWVRRTNLPSLRMSKKNLPSLRMSKKNNMIFSHKLFPKREQGEMKIPRLDGITQQCIKLFLGVTPQSFQATIQLLIMI